MATYTPITLADLTVATPTGTGVFDVLMQATKEHLDQEFKAGRIKGTDFANVYLGSLQAVLNSSLQFLLEKEKMNLDAELKVAQIALAGQELLIKEQQVLLAQAELGISQAKLLNVPKEGVVLDNQALDIAAKTALTEQQKTNLVAEALNIPKQGSLIDGQTSVQTAQAAKLASDKLDVEANTLLTTQRTANAVTENTVLVAQECKLSGEFDKIVAETGMVVDLRLKTAAETALLDQKRVTEVAQQTVTANQASLLTAQAQAFTNDYNVKMQDLRVKAWATARTTDPDNTPAMASF